MIPDAVVEATLRKTLLLVALDERESPDVRQGATEMAAKIRHVPGGTNRCTRWVQ